ncbi:MAG: TIGR03960 family B12-binding radical SAM protein [Nitrospinae bacterium]|nr:TIGR03960 family B12-binding radical SAM protein [Nitrospinota bacterium]
MNYKDLIELVQKPSRYIGKEVNSVHKDLSKVKTKIALIFPDLYEMGMSHLGLKILYHIINLRDDAAAERVFAPDTDYEELLLKNNLPLASLESSIPLNQFDMLGFTLQYELSYTNILNILKLGGIPLRQADRGDNTPLVIGGGPCVFNPEPLSDFFDLFVIGDGEEIVSELIDKYQKLKGIASASPRNDSRKEILKNLSDIEGIYVPSLFSVSYKDDNTIEKIVSLKEGYNSVKKRTIYDLNSSPYPTSQIVPYTSLIHDRVSVEIDRGCTHGCRFCQAGIIYRPLRERTPQKVEELLQETLKNTGYEEISLGSLSSGDYCNITPLAKAIMNKFEKDKISISLPSLRPDTLNQELLKEIGRVRKTGFTIAIEAGTQRMRDIINKKIKEEDIFSAVNSIASSGWDSLKLYFMIGLPYETDDDIEGIYNICNQILKREKRIKNINVGISSLVPKAHTPFQWVGQEGMDSLKRKLGYLHKKFKTNRKINMKWHKVEISFLEGVFARGDRRLGKVLEAAHEIGCKFDGWTERFDFNKWMAAFNRCGINPEFYANRNINKDETLPWGHIKTGVSKKFLYKEFEASVKDMLSSDCRYEGCIGCGLDPSRCKIQDARYKMQDARLATCNLHIATPARSPVQSRVRIRYEKNGDMKFLSHLEVGRTFSRAFRRAGIHLQYSEGYHPHPKIAFGFALPVGIESSWEYFDAELNGNLKIDEIINKLNTELPSGLKAISAEFIPHGTRSISDITNRVKFLISLQSALYSQQSAEERFKDFFLQDRVIIDRIRKDGVKKIDIKPLIESIKIIGHERELLKIEMVFNVLNGTLLQPIEVLQNLLSPNIGTSVLLMEKTGVEWRKN